MRIAVGVEYDGRGYCGWETQTNGPTLQAAVERALSTVANHQVRTVCAGRTDAGVHAIGQVLHFDTPAERTARGWTLGANSNLPASISLLWVKVVADEFHARFSARRRHYRYVICNRSSRPAILHGKVTWECAALELEPMREAATFLIGEHDFSAYRAAGCQARNPVRTVHTLEVSRSSDFIVLDIQANAFLHHMVRNVAGVLLAIGARKRPPEWAREVLYTKDRKAAGVTAPPDGLYLSRVDYPATFEVPQLSQRGLLW